MKTESFPENLVDYLLAGIDGFHMEALFAGLLSIRYGSKFDPMGGRKDGGADGKLEGVFSQDAGNYVQISKESGAERKIDRTITRLKEVGRNPTALTYWTNISVPMRDVFEENLTSSTGVTVRIREKASVLNLINESEETKTSFRAYFRRQLDELVQQKNLSAAEGLSRFSVDPTVYTFLKFEVGERTAKTALVVPVVDALIYWALRETDPDKGVLMSRVELKQKIIAALPGAQNVVVPEIDKRLKTLCEKNNVGVQRIRFYTEKDSFCIPHEMRLTLASESADDRKLTDEVLASLQQRATDAGAGKESEVVAKVTLDVVYRHFHEQGLVLAAFLEKRLESITTNEQVLELELNKSLDAETVSSRAYKAALHALREFFYRPTDSELRFQRLLSKTSLLLISLKHSPQLLDYFNQMTGKFQLVVGSDMIVKALSEYYLPPEAKTVTNLLSVSREAGARLILAEPVLEELFTHFNATNLEFKNHYASREGWLNSSITSQSCRILIRAYFYAKAIGSVKGWRNYIETFVDFDPLNTRDDKARSQLRAFLLKAFGFVHLTQEELSEGVDAAQKEELASLLTQRDPEKRRELADNDALMAYGIYAKRRREKEVDKYNGFGLTTWWLTKETRILAFTADLVRQHGAPYIMRPEFLINFLLLAPKALSKRAKELLPTHVGLQLGQHLPDYQMEKLLAAVEEWRDLPKERVEVRMSEFADKLKYDRLKQYGSEVDLKNSQVFQTQLAELKNTMAAEAKGP